MRSLSAFNGTSQRLGERWVEPSGAANERQAPGINGKSAAGTALPAGTGKCWGTRRSIPFLTRGTVVGPVDETENHFAVALAGRLRRAREVSSAEKQPKLADWVLNG